MARYRPRKQDAQFARMYRLLQEKRVLALVKDNQMNRHVILTAPYDYQDATKNWSLKDLVTFAQIAVENSCDDLVLGAGEQVEECPPHVHLLSTRRDARSLQRMWQAAGLGIVKITHADDRPKDFARIVGYVQAKWTYDRGEAWNMIVSGHPDTSRVA